MAGARDCIVELGYAGTSMSAIAERAGVTRGALQHHYGSRTDVLKALVDHFFAVLPELKGPSPDADSKEEIREFLAETFRVYGTRIAAAIMQLRIGAQAEPELQEVIEARFTTMDPMREKVWASLFRRAGLPTAEANRMREVVYAFLRGLAVRQAYLKRSYGVAAELSMITEMVTLYIERHTEQTERSAKRRAATRRAGDIRPTPHRRAAVADRSNP